MKVSLSLLRRHAIWLGAAAAIACNPVAPLMAQRLPDNAVPQHYTLHLTPDLDKATFAGDETIDITLAQPSSSITLNAIEVQFKSVTARVGKRESIAQVSLDESKEQATFTFPEPLPAGPVRLHVVYTGILNDKLRGFYLSKADGKRYAVTQFESTDARRAFPSFDEPAFKATFDVTIVAPKADMVISNTNVTADKPGPQADQHTVTFARTPKMSTYLLAFLIGDFQCISGSSDGVPIRACATPERVQYAHFALESAEYILNYYNNYFGIKYPMPKLDMIGIPDFEAGAMENFGAITYRESDMLVDEKNAPVDAKIGVAGVVAHEMAHQWFGDMVTMKWWNNIWLNEGFATWMSSKPLEAWKPEWHIDEGVAAELNGALNLDAQRVTRTIRAEANTPAEINEMFDGITYEKGGAILHMVESYLGEETFRQGVHNYLQAHIYGNATAEDFWNTQTATSHKPVDKIMPSFITEPGVPLLTFGNAANSQVHVSQSRFFLNPKTAPQGAGDQVWTIPVCFRSESAKPDCDLLASKEAALKVPSSLLFFANAGAAGYYRTQYTPEDYKTLLSHISSLTAPERISVVGNELALMRSGASTASDYLSLATSLKDDDSATVMESIANGIATLWTRVASTDEERNAFSQWVVATYKPRLESLGEPQASDSPDRQQLRAGLFELVGGLGQDPQTIARASQLAETYLSDPAKVNATLAQAAIRVAATHGDAAFFDLLQKTAETAKNPDVAQTALYDLARFRNSDLTRRALDYAVSGKVRNQDSIRLFAIAMQSPNTQDATWSYIRQNWPKVEAQFTMFTGAELVGSTSGFCTEQKREEAKQFFTEHKVAASANAMTRAQNAISDCVDLRAEQGPNLRQWLGAHAAGQ